MAIVVFATDGKKYCALFYNRFPTISQKDINRQVLGKPDCLAMRNAFELGE